MLFAIRSDKCFRPIDLRQPQSIYRCVYNYVLFNGLKRRRRHYQLLGATGLEQRGIFLVPNVVLVDNVPLEEASPLALKGNKGLGSALMAFEQGGTFIVPHLL